MLRCQQPPVTSPVYRCFQHRRLPWAACALLAAPCRVVHKQSSRDSMRGFQSYVCRWACCRMTVPVRKLYQQKHAIERYRPPAGRSEIHLPATSVPPRMRPSRPAAMMSYSQLQPPRCGGRPPGGGHPPPGATPRGRWTGAPPYFYYIGDTNTPRTPKPDKYQSTSLVGQLVV